MCSGSMSDRQAYTELSLSGDTENAEWMGTDVEPYTPCTLRNPKNRSVTDKYRTLVRQVSHFHSPLGNTGFGMDVKVDLNRTQERHQLLPKTTFSAYSDKNSSHGLTAEQLYGLKIFLVCSDCIFIGMQPILVHMSKNTEGKFSYNPVSVNLLTEVCKVVFALCVLLVVGTGRSGTPMYRSPQAFLQDAHHNRLLMIPAGLYAVNNYLKFVMQLYFKPTTTKMLGNLKIFTIAMLLKLVMDRKFTTIQWEALFLLVCGITINQLSNCASKSSKDPISIIAMMYTAGTVTVPAAASVFNEFALKKHMDTSVHLQNFFLYFYGMLFNLLGLWLFLLLGNETWSSVFSGHSHVTLLLISNNAIQGILSSFFFKFADTILKKYSSTIATIFTGVMSAILFGHELTLNFAIGISIVFVSMHQFFTFSKPKDQQSQANGRAVHFVHSPSADHLRITTDSLQSRDRSPYKYRNGEGQ